MLETETLISILDDYLMSLSEDCCRADPNLRLVDWEQGQIGGMLLAGRISGVLPREATFFLQDVINAWYAFVTRREAA